MASSQYNRTTLAANHSCYRKQMVSISECANVGECSYGFQPNTTSPFRTLGQMTFTFDISIRTSRIRSRLGENKEMTVAQRDGTSVRCLVVVREEALNPACNVWGKQQKTAWFNSGCSVFTNPALFSETAQQENICSLTVVYFQIKCNSLNIISLWFLIAFTVPTAYMAYQQDDNRHTKKTSWWENS